MATRNAGAPREERLASVKAQLEREPLWGTYLERVWARDIDNLQRALETLPH